MLTAHLQRGKSPTKSILGMTISLGALGNVEYSSLPLSGPLLPRVFIPVKVQSMDQIKLFNCGKTND